jgi:hypothetical protein
MIFLRIGVQENRSLTRLRLFQLITLEVVFPAAFLKDEVAIKISSAPL